MTQVRTGFYSGSFDPITNGHMEVIGTALISFDRLIIGIGVHSSKKGLFAYEERQELIAACLKVSDLDDGRVEIVTFDNLVVDAARTAGAHSILRGLRDATDFDYEMQMAGMNAEMAADLPTIFIPASVATRPISATLVRQIASMGGDVSSFVPVPVLKALAAKK